MSRIAAILPPFLPHFRKLHISKGIPPIRMPENKIAAPPDGSRQNGNFLFPIPYFLLRLRRW
jgi:hypothetical protein